MSAVAVMCVPGPATADAKRPRLTFSKAIAVSLDAAHDRAQADVDSGAQNVSYSGRSCTRQNRLRIECGMNIDGTDPNFKCPDTDTAGAPYNRNWTQVVRKNATTHKVSTWIIDDVLSHTCPTTQG